MKWASATTTLEVCNFTLTCTNDWVWLQVRFVRIKFLCFCALLTYLKQNKQSKKVAKNVNIAYARKSSVYLPFRSAHDHAAYEIRRNRKKNNDDDDDGGSGTLNRPMLTVHINRRQFSFWLHRVFLISFLFVAEIRSASNKSYFSTWYFRIKQHIFFPQFIVFSIREAQFHWVQLSD